MKNKTKTKLSLKSKIKWLIFLLILIGIGSGAYFLFHKSNNVATIEIISVKPTIGDISTSIDGSGVIEPLEEYTISSMLTGDILEDYLEVGDVLTKDEVLYVIDASDADDIITRAESSLESQINSYEETIEGLDDYNIRSDISGTITQVFVTVGDRVSTNTNIAEVIDTKTLEIILPFNKIDAQNISVGQSADVVITSTGETLKGTVTTVASGDYISNTGTFICDVKITVNNPGVLTEDYTATASVNGISAAGTANFAYKNKTTITAEASGEIQTLAIMRGDKVTANKLVGTIYSSSVDRTLENAELALEDAYLSYETALENLDDYTITSPIDGTVMSKSYKAGDSLDGSKTTLATISDMSKVKFEMSVDETSINIVSIGQEVLVTADSTGDQVFTGEVVSIALTGTQSSGVTIYPVEVEIEDYGILLPGMNVTAKLVCESATNVLTIPQNYVNRGNLVLISEEDAKAYEKAEENKSEIGKIAGYDTGIEGYKYLTIAVGLSDGTNVEVTDGLLKETTIYMQVITYAKTEITEDGGMNMGMMGGMSSGMSSDKMNSSGMSRPSGMSGGNR